MECLVCQINKEKMTSFKDRRTISSFKTSKQVIVETSITDEETKIHWVNKIEIDENNNLFLTRDENGHKMIVCYNTDVWCNYCVDENSR